jgi:anthranilate phosphoribosyltransferase
MGERTWPNLLTALLHGQELPTADTAWAMAEIMSGSATPAQIAGFALALRAKGESAAELAGLVDAMLSRSARVDLTDEVLADAIDVVGTGGDRAHTVNISTMTAIVAAGSGVRVVKHGNRASSSSCGAADLLEFLGIPIDLGPAGVARCVIEAGIGFCFAARFHPGMRHSSVPRREIGVPTFFNFLGPLTNPARPRSGAVGCFDPRMAGVMAQVFAGRGDSVLVAPTRVWIASGGVVTETLADAADLGVARSAPGDLRGGDAAFNADVALRLLAGETGPVRDAVLVNTAAALAARDGVSGDLVGAMRAGMGRAAESIDSGAAARTLERWAEVARAAKSAE